MNAAQDIHSRYRVTEPEETEQVERHYLPDELRAELEEDSLDAARGILLAIPLGAALWTLLGLAIWFLAGCASPPVASEEYVSCLIDEITYWLEANYAEEPVQSRPAFSFWSQGELQNLTGNAHAGSQILGAHWGGNVYLWDLNDMTRLESQSTLAHELAHWIDFMENRPFDHGRVYDIQHEWEVAHWPGGVPTC